jgi:L-cystine uptake protein TcyP (sodium:dicarboxylate symporter family)
MRMIMRAYDYVFYTFYRFWEIAPSRWWSEWKASVTLVFLCVLLISAISNIQNYLFKNVSLSDYPYFSLALGLGIGIIHHFMYTYKDKWKKKIEKFRDIDKKKDVYGVLLVLIIVILIISVYSYSNHLLRTVDWQNI